MAHASEDSRRLVIHTTKSIATANLLPTEATVFLFILPADRTGAESRKSAAFQDQLLQFAESSHVNSIIAILTSPEDAAELLPSLTGLLKLQLWVAVKRTPMEDNGTMRLRENHAALLILSRYHGSLRHTKTRIAYTYCPFCDKTTKDYGGKKHTYHEYGTLMSDVWRDIQIGPDTLPTPIIDRLADVFGLEEFRQLQVVDLRNEKSLRPVARKYEEFKEKRTRTVSLPSKLIQGDVLAELSRLPDASVDFCFADPPYNLDKKYDIWDDALDVNNYLDWCNAWIHQLARVVRPGRTCAVLNIPSIAVKHFHQMKAAGLSFQNWIAWEGLSLPVRMIMPAHYSIVCFSKGPARPLPGLQSDVKAQDREAIQALKDSYCLRQSCVSARKIAREPDREPISDLWWDIHRLKHNSRRVDHPCQLPPVLMYRLIALFTKPGEMVLDPFNGAGTTSLCAAMLERRFLGIEVSENYYEIALRRHEQLKRGEDPFAKKSGVPRAKNSRVKRIGGDRYKVSKKELQLEVKRIANQLQRMPTRNELESLSRYPAWMYEKYFLSWGEVCAAARTTGMTETRGKPAKRLGGDQKMLFE